MKAADLIELGVELEVRGDNLVVRGADDDLLPAIQRHKHRLIAQLRGRVCNRCRHYWPRAEVGDCQMHQFEVLPLDDCGGWSRGGGR